jgi:hypothetical protein
MDHHALDQATQDAQRLVPQPRLGQRRMQPLDLAPVDLGEVRVQADRRRRIGGEFLLQGRLARLQVVQLLLQAGGAVPLDQGLDQLVELARDLGQLPLLAALAAVASRRCRLTSSW